MKDKILIIFIINLLFLSVGIKDVIALEHTQKEGLFSMDVPEGWHWVEYPQEIIITYPDGKTVAIDIQLVASVNLSKADIRKTLKEGDDKMITEGIKAHNGTFIDEKETAINGVFARQLDFKTSPPESIEVTYISFFNKGYAFTITYGSADEKMREVMDDAVATIKFR